MGRQKNTKPQRNVDSHGETEQLGAVAAVEECLAWTNEAYVQDVKTDEPVQKKRKVAIPRQKEPAAAPQVDPPEVTIESIVFNGESHWKIHLLSRNPGESPCRKEWMLREYRLVRSQLLDCNGSFSNETATVRTSAEALLQHCETCCSGNANDMSAIGRAVQDGTLQLSCSVAGDSSVQVLISLTDLAFTATESLPLHRRTSKKYQSATHLHHALACLFPNTVVAHVMSKTQQAPPITAKTVYDLIDNVQLQDYEAKGGYDSKPMHIPGLLPTLRPYQEAAVKWMIQREKGPTESQEWELAWVVLTNPVVQQANSETMIMNVGEVVSVPEWKRRTQLDEIKSGILYCPFVGMLAKSGVDAYMATLHSFLEGGAGCDWSNPTGGILADSMGLGKTVEVCLYK